MGVGEIEPRGPNSTENLPSSPKHHPHPTSPLQGEGRSFCWAADVHHTHTILSAGSWDPDKAAGTVTLAWDDRHRRRILLESDQGLSFLLDLHRPARLAEGDGLLLDDGRVIRVVAAAEPVLEIRAGSSSLTRLAYHLGNRHLDLEIAENVLIIRADPVIAEMVRHLGGTVAAVTRPFTPEPGAYDGHAGHGHEHHDHHHD